MTLIKRRRRAPALAAAPAMGAAEWLSLSAAPTFAIMALLTGVLGGGIAGYDLLCRARRVTTERNGPDVPADERLPLGALAEADRPTRGCRGPDPRWRGSILAYKADIGALGRRAGSCVDAHAIDGMSGPSDGRQPA